MTEPRTDPTTALRRAMWLGLLALSVLAAAALRHQLVWGESERMPWLLPLLNTCEGLGLGGFVVLMALAWRAALRAAPACTVRELLRRSWPLLALAVVVPLIATTDPIDYVVRGRILTVHGANPYTHVATGFPDDPFLGFGDRGWKDMPLPYGPLVANLQGVIAWLAHLLPVSPRVELLAALLLTKALFAASLWVASLLLARVAEVLRPGAGNAAFVAIAWNPLFLFEGVVNAHNEPLLLLLLAATLAAATAQRYAASVFALGCGVLTKIVPVLLGPALLVKAIRDRRLGGFALGGALLLPLVAAGWWQFFRDEGALDVVRRQGELAGGGLWWAVSQATGLEVAALVGVGRGAVVAWIALTMWRLWRRPDAEQLVFAFASTLGLLALCGAGLFCAWYHLWWAPFALLLGRGYLYRVALVASVVTPLAHLLWVTVRRFDEPAQWLGVSMAVVVPLLGGLLLRGPRSAPGRAARA
ncbi:MAG: hypothetical protein H6835_10410 [Planctomycetes bacterium]|nr:hypothetical protein [Planctomycetota bacterium]